MPETTMTFFTREQAHTQLAGLEIVDFEEEDQDGTTARGDVKHWHVYHIVAVNSVTYQSGDGSQ